MLLGYWILTRCVFLYCIGKGETLLNQCMKCTQV